MDWRYDYSYIKYYTYILGIIRQLQFTYETGGYCYGALTKSNCVLTDSTLDLRNQLGHMVLQDGGHIFSSRLCFKIIKWPNEHLKQVFLAVVIPSIHTDNEKIPS